jgi:lipoic acid synthetase
MEKEENTKFPKRPSWLKVKIPHGNQYSELKKLLSVQSLHTVCEEARCPNLCECWNRGTATFMILGDTCSRNCRFCAVTDGKPAAVDCDEPRRVAESAEKMQLKYAVITSVTRDDLEDGGSGIFAQTINEIRQRIPQCRIEVLIPDFQGNEKDLLTVICAKPDILNHNVETVPRLYSKVRPQANYRQSLTLLERAKLHGMTTKSGIMVGIGEEAEEVLEVMHDLRQVGVDILTIGQYLQPTHDHLSVARYVHPDEFHQFKIKGLEMGFGYVESAPLVRSSYHADEQIIFSSHP